MRTITDHLAAVDGVSPALAADIADAFPTWEALAGASTDDLRAVKGVGPVLATRIQGAAVDANPTTAATTRTDEATAADRAAATTARAERDFAEAIDRRQFGPITLPANLPWPVNVALDTTETVVGLGLKVTSGVLSSVGRKLR